MRKRCNRKPRRNLQDPLAYVLNGMLPVSVATDPIITVRIKNHDALGQCCKGFANFQYVDTLVAAFNMSEALIGLGIGAEYADEIRAAQDAIYAMVRRPRMLFTGPEINAVNLAMDIHDAQLDDSRTTVATMEQAVLIVKKIIASKKARKLVAHG